jgi:hypothetical protein
LLADQADQRPSAASYMGSCYIAGEVEPVLSGSLHPGIDLSEDRFDS